MAWMRRIFIIHIFVAVSKCRTIPNISEYGLQQIADNVNYNDYTKSHIGSLNQKYIDRDGDSEYQKSGEIINKNPLYYYTPESSDEDDFYMPNNDIYDSDEENNFRNYDLSSEGNLNSYTNKKPGEQVIRGNKNSKINLNGAIQAISQIKSSLDINDYKEMNEPNEANMDQIVDKNENKQQNQPETTTTNEHNFHQPDLEEVSEEEHSLANNDEFYDEPDYDSQQDDSLEKNQVMDNVIEHHEYKSAVEKVKKKTEISSVPAASRKSNNYYLGPKGNQQFYTIKLSNGHTAVVPLNNDETYVTSNDEYDLNLHNTALKNILHDNDDINFHYPNLDDTDEDQSEIEEDNDKNSSLVHNDDSYEDSDYDSQQDSIEKNQDTDNNVKPKEDKSSDELTEQQDEISYIPAASSQSNTYYLDPNRNQQYYTVQTSDGQSVLVPVNNGQIYVPNNDQNSAPIQNMPPNNIPQYVTSSGDLIQGNGQQYYVLNNGQQYMPSNAQPLQSNGQYVLNNGQYVPNQIQVEPSNGQYILANTAPQYIPNQPAQVDQYIVQNNGQQYLPNGQGYISIPWNSDQNTVQNNGQIYVPVDAQLQNPQSNIITVPSGSLVTIGNNPPLLVFKEEDEDGNTSKSEDEDKPAEDKSTQNKSIEDKSTEDKSTEEKSTEDKSTEDKSTEDKSTEDNTAEVKTLKDKSNSNETLEENPEQNKSSEEDEDKLKKFEDDA